LMILSPFAIVLAQSYTVFHYTSPFVFLGMSSLIMIMMADRVRLVGLVIVYVPALYAVYVLVSGGNPIPFISLAAGYILATPLVLAIGTATSSSPSGLVTSYFSAYVSGLILYGAIHSSYYTPERLFIFLVRGFLSYVASSESLGLIPPQTPETTLIATPTAASTIGLVIRLMTVAKPVKGQPEASAGFWLKALILGLSAGIGVASFSFFNPTLSAVASVTLSSSLLLFLAIYSRHGKT
ncbi:MAG: hypothetical protein QXI97_02640, partial [Nitrososphaerota archaeon]